MPFLIPTKRSSISKSMRFSKYKNIDEDESPYFQLQKRKSSKEPGETSGGVVGRWQAKSSKRPTYRIITKGHPYYEVAYDFDLEQIKQREWHYIVNELPRHLPSYLSQSARTKWLLAHFTQLALETDATGAQPPIESDDDDDAADNKSPPKQGKGNGAVPGSPMLLTAGSATSPMTLSSTAGTMSSTAGTMSSLSLGSTASVTASPARVTAGSSSNASRTGPPSGVIARTAIGGTGTIHATAALPSNGVGNLSSDDDKGKSQSRSGRPTSSLPGSSTTATPSSRVTRASDGSGSPFTAPPLSIAQPPGARFSLRGRRAFWVLLSLTNVMVVLLRDASLSSFALILLLINLLLYSAIVRGEPVAFTIFVTRGHPTVSSIPVESTNTSSSSSSSSSRSTKSSKSSSKPSRSQSYGEDVHAARFAPAGNLTALSPQSATTPSASTSNIASVNVDADNMKVLPIADNSDGKGQRDMDGKGSDSEQEGDQGSEDADRDDDDKDGSASPVSTTSTRANASAPSSSGMAHGGNITRIRIGQTIGKISESAPFLGNTGKTSGWCSIDGTTFQVRLPGYKIHKKKGPSAPPLYDIFSSDAFRCPDKKIDNIMSYIKMPPIPQHLWPAGWTPPSDGVMRDDGKDWPDCSINGVPPLILIHFLIPEYAPANPVWGKVREDGEGYSMLFFFWLTEYGKAEATANKNPAIKLFQEFLRRDGDIDFRNRFKCIARVQNPDDCNLGGMLKSTLKKYNAKPWLTGPLCHNFIKGFNYMEADIDVHRFSYFGRQAANGFLPQFNNFVLDLAFTVEGQDDRELPEQVLCSCRLFKIMPSQAKTIGYWQEQERKEAAERERTQSSSTTAAPSTGSGSTSSGLGVPNMTSSGMISPTTAAPTGGPSTLTVGAPNGTNNGVSALLSSPPATPASKPLAT